MSYICAICRASPRLASRRAVNSTRAYSSAIEHDPKQSNSHTSEGNKPLVRNQGAVSLAALGRTIKPAENIPAQALSGFAAEVKYRSSQPRFKIRKLRSPARRQRENIDKLLANPSWSVRSLLPDPDAQLTEEITPNQLHHLLRLSALPQPKSPEEEAEMLKTLHTQLHFVRDIQNVDTDGVETLQSLRDETDEGLAEVTISLDSLKKALDEEEVIGRSQRPRRKRGQTVNTVGIEDWDVLRAASEKVVTPGGSYFVVRSGKENQKPLQQDQQVNVTQTGPSTASDMVEDADLGGRSQLEDLGDQDKARQ